MEIVHVFFGNRDSKNKPGFFFLIPMDRRRQPQVDQGRSGNACGTGVWDRDQVTNARRYDFFTFVHILDIEFAIHQPGGRETGEELILRADAAMYRIKHGAKNGFGVAPPAGAGP